MRWEKDFPSALFKTSGQKTKIIAGMIAIVSDLPPTLWQRFVILIAITAGKGEFAGQFSGFSVETMQKENWIQSLSFFDKLMRVDCVKSWSLDFDIESKEMRMTIWSKVLKAIHFYRSTSRKRLVIEYLKKHLWNCFRFQWKVLK